MSDNRRSAGATSLRSFFDDQLHHLRTLVGSLGHHGRAHDEAALTADDKQVIENFVDAANSKMRAADDYVEKLREHVCALYHHILSVADQIPQPIELNRHTFRSNPLINALFVNAADIDRLFNTNIETGADLSVYQMPVIYALLTACKTEKSILGIGMLGEMLVRDVPQQSVNFSSHKLHAPCASQAELNVALKKYLFDRVVALIKQEMASRIAAQDRNSGDHSYESRLKSLANPEVYLSSLNDYLVIPTKLLRIDTTHFKLNKLGIKLADEDRACANEFDIHELIWVDNMRNIVLQIAYIR